MSAGQARDLLDDLLSSRQENRHFDGVMDVMLSFRDVASSMWVLRMLKVDRNILGRGRDFVEMSRKPLGDICRPCGSKCVEWWLWSAS